MRGFLGLKLRLCFEFYRVVDPCSSKAYCLSFLLVGGGGRLLIGYFKAGHHRPTHRLCGFICVISCGLITPEKQRDCWEPPYATTRRWAYWAKPCGGMRQGQRDNLEVHPAKTSRPLLSSTAVEPWGLILDDMCRQKILENHLSCRTATTTDLPSVYAFEGWCGSSHAFVSPFWFGSGEYECECYFIEKCVSHTFSLIFRSITD